MNYIACFKFNFLMMTIALLNSLSVIAQSSNERLCVLFEAESQVIEISSDVDSTRFGFNIIKKGFETKEARDEAKKEANEVYKKNRLIPYQHPEIYLTYTSFRKPAKYNSIEDFGNCKAIVVIEEFRKQDFSPPDETGLAQIYLIEKSETARILVWAASYFE